MFGWFYCGCPAGYSSYHNPLTGTRSCQDDDECTAGQHTCHPPAACTNTPGGYACVCTDTMEQETVCPSACLVEGRRRENGEAWVDGCSSCVCEAGVASCQQTSCSCSSQLDTVCCPQCQSQASCSHQVNILRYRERERER